MEDQETRSLQGVTFMNKKDLILSKMSLIRHAVIIAVTYQQCNYIGSAKPAKKFVRFVNTSKLSLQASLLITVIGWNRETSQIISCLDEWGT
jgi:hypothetical protein